MTKTHRHYQNNSKASYHAIGKKIPDKTILPRACHVLSYKLSQNKSSAPDGVTKRLKILTHYLHALLFRLFVPCQEPQSFF